MSAVLLSVLFAASPTEGRKVLVGELTGLGLDERIVEAFQNYMQSSLQTIDGVTLVSRIDLDFALADKRNRRYRTCKGLPRTRCAVGRGELVGADVVVHGTITSLGEAFNVNLRAVGVKERRVLGKYSAAISGSRDQLIPKVRLAAFELIAPDKVLGSLFVETDVSGVAIEIDGKSVGTTPLDDPVTNLTPGKHVLVLRRPGFKEVRQEFTIEAFETARLKVELKAIQSQ